MFSLTLKLESISVYNDWANITFRYNNGLLNKSTGELKKLTDYTGKKIRVIFDVNEE